MKTWVVGLCLLLSTPASAGIGDWFRIKHGVSVPEEHEELARELKFEFPHGRLAADLLRIYGQEMHEGDSLYPILFLSRKILGLHEYLFDYFDCKQLITDAHWLAHIYEYREEWEKALFALHLVFNPQCTYYLHQDTSFYEFENHTFPYRLPPIHHIRQHLNHVLNNYTLPPSSPLIELVTVDEADSDKIP